MSIRTYTPAEILPLIARYRWIILIPVAIGIAATPIVTRFAKPRYRSEALLLVIPQQVPEEYVQPTVAQTVADRLPSITAQILSRSKLERIITEMDLYKSERAQQVMEDVVERMRNRDIETVPVGRPASKDVDAFRVRYVSNSPDIARKVTERLASLYINQNEQDRANQAENTSQFLANQLETTKQRLIEQEKKLEAYRKSHPGQLPSQLQANVQAIQTGNMQLTQLYDQMNRAQEKKLLLERQLADAKAIQVTVAPVAAGAEGGGGPLTTAQQLEMLRNNLALLKQRVLPTHPDIPRTERAIAEMTKKLEAENANDAATPKVLTPAAAAQQKKILDLQAELLVADQQVNNYKGEEARIKRTIADYQARIDALPTRESELTELMREYNSVLSFYNTLVTKREDAVIGANLERRKIGEQFQIIDPASRPEKPFNNVQRIAISVSGIGVGLIFGVLIAAVREYRDSSFRSRGEVVKILSLPVLASIPVMSSDRERQSERRRQLAMDIGGSAMLLASFAVVAAWRLFY